MENNRGKRAVAYIRVSSEKQKDNVSKENQWDRIKSKADAEGIEIVHTYIDDGVSAKNTDRKELKSMLEFIGKKNSNIDFVLVYSLSRLSRDMPTFIEGVKMLLRAKGVGIRSATEHIDETPIGQFNKGLHILMAQFDNQTKMQYTRDNMKTLASQGYWQNSPPHGYDTCKIANEMGKPSPSLKLNNMASRVKQVLERFSSGDISKAELARFATDVGLRSRNGKKLTETSIKNLLESPAHAGYVYGALTDFELVLGKHPAIISTATFEVNQSLLRNTKFKRDGEVHAKGNPEYLLRGLLLCGNCNNPMYGSAPRTGNGGRSPRYHCARLTCKGKARSVKSSLVHEDFDKLLKRIKPNDAILNLYKEILVRQANASLDNLLLLSPKQPNLLTTH